MGDESSRLWAASPLGQVGLWPITLLGQLSSYYFFLHVTGSFLAGTPPAKQTHFLVYKLLFSHCKY